MALDCNDCKHRDVEFDEQPCFSCIPPNDDKWEAREMMDADEMAYHVAAAHADATGDDTLLASVIAEMNGKVEAELEHQLNEAERLDVGRPTRSDMLHRIIPTPPSPCGEEG